MFVFASLSFIEFTYLGHIREGFGFANPNHAAAFLASLFPLLWGWQRLPGLGWSLSLLLALPLAMTFSRSGIVVLFLELLAYGLLTRFRQRRWLMATASISLLVLACWGCLQRFTLDKACSNRLLIWIAGLRLYARNPDGVGLGNSGTIVSDFLLESIRCRTLVNSHLTLMVEFGLLAGVAWFACIFYALMRGIRHPRLWCSFAGLCLSATSSSVFDWQAMLGETAVPSSFRLLAWLIPLLFLVLWVMLCWGNFRWRSLVISIGLGTTMALLPLCLYDKRTPHIDGGLLMTSPTAPLALYDSSWSPGTVLPYCGDRFRIPLQPGYQALHASQLLLFGDAAEYAHLFPHTPLLFIHPPPFFKPPSNAVKIILANYDLRQFDCPVERR